MYTATLMPQVADRKLREQWELERASSVHQRAMNRAFDVLSQPNPRALDTAADQAVRAHFDGLVAGDAVLPPGWQRYKVGAAEVTSERRGNRRRQAARSN